LDFTAIDFETANRRPDSACQLAAVVVQGGKIVDQRSWLIRPRPFYFSRFNIQIHGIHPEQVENEPEFGCLWPEIEAFLGNRCLVAHNAAFDIKVLTACLAAHRKPIPDLHFTCTRLIAKQTWPSWGRYGLKPIADRLDIRFRHHDALEDSTACAKVLLTAAIRNDCQSLESLEQKLKIDRGSTGRGGYQGARMSRRRAVSRTTARPIASQSGSLPPGQLDRVAEPPVDTPHVDLHRLMLRAEMVRSLAGKCVVVTGAFQSMSREQMILLVERAGGTCQTAQRQATQQQPADLEIKGHVKDPREAAGRVASVQSVVTWSEDQFLEQIAVSVSTIHRLS